MSSKLQPVQHESNTCFFLVGGSFFFLLAAFFFLLGSFIWFACRRPGRLRKLFGLFGIRSELPPLQSAECVVRAADACFFL